VIAPVSISCILSTVPPRAVSIAFC
jgi:hypothetical protein